MLATVVCLPAGIAALVYGARVPSRWAAGDSAGARRASHQALVWVLTGTGTALALLAGWGVLTAVGVARARGGL